MNKFDVIIIGSGLGGLVCGVTLSKEGYNVCVVEKNPLSGGCFQSFKRHGRLLDTGIHYIGSLDEGEILRQYFTYFGIMDKLKLKRLDEDNFDIVNYKGKDYPYAMGHENFIRRLSDKFPHEKAAIQHYIELLKATGDTIHIDNLRKGKLSTGGMEQFSVSAWDTICSLTNNKELRQVLSSTAMLYGGQQSTSTFYHHSMITNSYLQGAYRFVDGSMQLVDAMTDIIRKNGGTVLTNSKVTSLYITGDEISSVEINGSEKIKATYVISSLHPVVTMHMVQKTPIIRQAYLSRLSSLPNSYGLLSVYLIKEKKSTLYINHNRFLYEHENVWYPTQYPEDKQIRCALVTMQANSELSLYSEVICITTPMYFDELELWEHTSVEKRGETYKEFKEKKARELISFVEQYLPDVNKNTKHIYITTPLTYRDYTGIPEGSAYGIMKNYNNPFATIIPSRTRIPNLYLTGQNLNVHGALGVTLTAMLTCSELLGSEYLAKKVGEA